MARARRNLWLAWVAVTVVGAMLALAFTLWVAHPATNWFLGTVPASSLRDVLQGASYIIVQMIGAALIASAQVLVLRRVLGRGVSWVTAAAIGALLGWFLTYWLGGQLVPHRLPIPPPAVLRLDGLILVCARSLVLATCLWIACLQGVDRRALFILASVLAAAVGDWYLAPALAFNLPLSESASTALEVSSTAAFAILNGALTGLALAITLIHHKPRRRLAHSRSRTPRRKPARSASR